MHHVFRENALLFIFSIILLIIIEKFLPKINYRQIIFLSNAPYNVAVLIHVTILLVAEVSFFADYCRCTKNDTNIFFFQLFKNGFIKFFKFISIGTCSK